MGHLARIIGQVLISNSVKYVASNSSLSKHLQLQPKPIDCSVITHHMQRYAVWFGGSMLASTVSVNTLLLYSPLKIPLFSYSKLILVFMTKSCAYTLTELVSLTNIESTQHRCACSVTLNVEMIDH